MMSPCNDCFKNLDTFDKVLLVLTTIYLINKLYKIL